MIVVLNGPLGIGKSTLAELLAESVESCVHLDGDALIAVNPVPDDSLSLLNATLAVLIPHYREVGYRHFVINHIWRTSGELEALRSAVGPAAELRAFLLTLPLEDNLRRIEKRQCARAVDEADFERTTLLEERQQLYGGNSESLGELFDVAGTPADLVANLKLRLHL